MALLQVLPGHSCATAGSSCTCSAFPRHGALLTTRRWEGPWSQPWCAEMAIWMHAGSNGGTHVSKAGGLGHLTLRGNQGNQTPRVFKWQLRWGWHFFFNPWAESERRESASNIVLSLVYSRHILQNSAISSSSWKEISWFRDFSKPLKIFVCALPPQLLGAQKTTAFAGRQ